MGNLCVIKIYKRNFFNPSLYLMSNAEQIGKFDFPFIPESDN
jgi:hypothetical protein